MCQHRETLVLSPEDARCAIFGDYPDMDVVLNEIIDQGRWSTYHRVVVKYMDKFYSVKYSQGSTESQEEAPFEYDTEVKFDQVFPVEKTIIVYQ